MTALTKIEWATHTFNPWIGCQHVSPGCVNCYAEVNTFTRAQRAKGDELWGGPLTKRHVVADSKWVDVLKWDDQARRTGEVTRVFCASMADWLEKRRDLTGPRARLIALIEETPSLTWLMLTKRPENAHELLPGRWFAPGGWPRHVWFGFSAEDQRRLDERAPHAAAVPAPIRFISYEPALGPIDFEGDPHTGPGWLRGYHAEPVHVCGGEDLERCGRMCPEPEQTANESFHLVIYGGESGPKSRANDIAWARATRDQCRDAGVAFFYKQGGTSHRCEHSSKGGCFECIPEDLRIRQFPKETA